MSEPLLAFHAEQMIGLLDIDNYVWQIVYTLRGKGVEVQGKVVDLFNKYTSLLGDLSLACMHHRRFIEILQGDFKGIEKILTFTMRGTVREMLTELKLEQYFPNFKEKDLEDAYQLIQSSFDIEEIELPTRGAKDKIHSRIQYYRHQLTTITDRIHGVKEEPMWKDIEKQVEEIVNRIDRSKMGEKADRLQLNHPDEVQDLLSWFQTVLKGATALKDKVVEFETEAERLQGNLSHL